MARVKLDEIVDGLSSEMRRALADAVTETTGQEPQDDFELYRAFKRALGRRCSGWTRVHDRHVGHDDGRPLS